jgi:hypothetical protein
MMVYFDSEAKLIDENLVTHDVQSNLYYGELEAFNAFASLTEIKVTKIVTLAFDHDNKVTKRAKICHHVQKFGEIRLF